MARHLKPGDRVVMTDEAVAQGLKGHSGSPYGTVKRLDRRGLLVVVKDGQVTEHSYHPDFWRRLDTTEE